MRRITEPLILLQSAAFIIASSLYGLSPLLAWTFAVTVIAEGALGFVRIGGR